MGVKLERLVRTYYETLEEGKVLGRKCPVCGNVEWPPVYACNACGSTETEWYEMSGKGELQTLMMPTVMSFKPALKDLEPYAYGAVQCEEGPVRNVMVLGVTRQNEAYIREHLPYPVKMKIVTRTKICGPDGRVIKEGFEVPEGTPLGEGEKRVSYKTAVFTVDVEGGEEEKAAAEEPKSETLSKLMEMVARTYRKAVSDLRPDMAFEVELKAPSVVFVGLVAQLEDEFDKLISITDAAAAKTIKGLADLIDNTKE